MSLQLTNYQLKLADTPMFNVINLNLAAQQIAAIVGASGSGKSTLLADISGALLPEFSSTGAIILNDRDLRPLTIAERRVGLLFQDDLLFPHLNVYENLLFALPGHLSKAQKRQRIEDALVDADLMGYGSRDIATLSGGQRARVSLLRTLLSEPELVLLDEPFSKLDKELRVQFRDWVFAHIRQLNIPAILVTHDPDDIPADSHIIHLEACNA